METMSVWPEAGPLQLAGDAAGATSLALSGAGSPTTRSLRGMRERVRGALLREAPRVAHRRNHAFGRVRRRCRDTGLPGSQRFRVLRRGGYRELNHRCQPFGAVRWGRGCSSEWTAAMPETEHLRVQRTGTVKPSGSTGARLGPSGPRRGRRRLVLWSFGSMGLVGAKRPIPVDPSGTDRADRKRSSLRVASEPDRRAADLRVGSKHRPTRSQTKPRDLAFPTALGRWDVLAESEAAGRNGWRTPPARTTARQASERDRSKAHGSIERRVVATSHDRNGLFGGRKP